jgi:DnaJ-class molecular chaperone
LDGHSVEIDRVGQITKPGVILRMKGEGMPVFEQYGENGDLLVTVVVKMPITLSVEQRMQLNEFF